MFFLITNLFLHKTKRYYDTLEQVLKCIDKIVNMSTHKLSKEQYLESVTVLDIDVMTCPNFRDIYIEDRVIYEPNVTEKDWLEKPKKSKGEIVKDNVIVPLLTDAYLKAIKAHASKVRVVDGGKIGCLLCKE